ncbi:MAG: agmatinase [Desulfohalobiaceae bacterium]|nr:agmatinase [Desulfohalobiaceae bacterium]
MYTNYLDLDSRNGQLVHVWPVPYEATASFAKGTLDGPRSLLQASYEIETWDQELGADLADLAHFETIPFFPAPVSGPQDCYRQLLAALQKRLDPGSDFLLTLGGEHSLALAPIEFYRRHYPELVVLQLDAHADLRQEFQGSRYSHACVMARAREQGAALAQVGIRSLCREESGTIDRDRGTGLLTLFAWETGSPVEAAARVREFIDQRPLYISFDADVLDPSIMPGTGTPEPGGLSYTWLNNFWSGLFSGVRLLGMDFCETSPLPGCGVVSESVAVKCINKILLTYLLHHRLESWI